MSYVVKVGDYYVRDFNTSKIIVNGKSERILIGDIILSKELMRGQNKELAEMLAKKLNATLVEIPDEVTMCEEG